MCPAALFAIKKAGGVRTRDEAAAGKRVLFELGQTGGTGLGLPIVRQMVLGHGGEVAIESVPGLGTALRFTLQLIRSSQIRVR